MASATIMEDVEVPAELGSDNEILIPARTERRQKLNPAYDHTQTYLPRTQRPEWDAVGQRGSRSRSAGLEIT